MNKKVLIVEDDEKQGKVLARYLEHEGFSVRLAHNAENARNILQNNEFNLVLLDWKLPDMDGLELLSEIKQNNPITQVIMLTAFATVERAVKAIKMGAYHYLPKPVDLDELILLIERALKEQELQKEIITLKQRLQEVIQPEELSIVAESDEMKRVITLVNKVAGTDATVLICGESGSGKEIISQLIHKASPRNNGPFVKINCAAIPEGLLESELFGYEKGAFTGANKTKPGLLETADGGTLFLDEIGDMPLSLQAKLLRVLQDGVFHRVGGIREISVDVRIIAATNKDLESLIEQKLFREDLYWRLNVFKVTVPPLRQRKKDIPHLIRLFIQKYAEKHKKNVHRIDSDSLRILLAYEYPGNVRELENIIERAVILADSDTISPKELPAYTHLERQHSADSAHDHFGSLPLTEAVENYEKHRIIEALNQTGGVKTRAAKILGISERMLRYKMRKYGLENKKQ